MEKADILVVEVVALGVENQPLKRKIAVGHDMTVHRPDVLSGVWTL